MKFIKSTPI